MKASRVDELLEFDLALTRHSRPMTARSTDAPLFFGDVAPRPPLVGFDEAGRGALAGPVIVGCVAIPARLLDDREGVRALLGRVDDSKRLTATARDAAYDDIVGCARWSAGCASAAEIDEIGIVAACEIAARRAYRRLGLECALAVFDRGLSLGEPVSLDEIAPRPAPSRQGPSAPAPGVSFTKGDTRSLHVAAASLVAKVTRDRLLVALDARFFGYGLAKHKGYGTAEHRRRLRDLGPSPLHRATFLHRADASDRQSC